MRAAAFAAGRTARGKPRGPRPVPRKMARLIERTEAVGRRLAILVGELLDDDGRGGGSVLRHDAALMAHTSDALAHFGRSVALVAEGERRGWRRTWPRLDLAERHTRENIAAALDLRPVTVLGAACRKAIRVLDGRDEPGLEKALAAVDRALDDPADAASVPPAPCGLPDNVVPFPSRPTVAASI